MSKVENALRQQIMAVLAQRVARNGGVISRRELEALDVDGRSFRLIDQSRGIWNPRWLDSTLSIMSSPTGPYDDTEVEGGLLRYDYRAGSIEGDNRKLREAVRTRTPLILLRKIADGVFVPVFPVYAVADDPGARQFVIAIDEAIAFLPDPLHDMSEDQRRYSERIAHARLHQQEFRGRVLLAYRRRCSICSLRHPELLDAAHILPDSHERGQPVVTNGLSLCKIHHASYDQNLLGIDPDYRVHLDADLLHEIDGPMLKHGLQDMHGRSLEVPVRLADRPDRDRLALRFEAFGRAS